MLPIKGIQKTTLVDYPGKIATTIFLGGCNFRCPFCHNVALVKNPNSLPTIDEEEMLSYLAGRTKQIEGVCISGGEPTLYKDLPNFIKEIKKLGFYVKLDSNGTNPTMLSELLSNNLLDYIAMDIKGPVSLYNQASGVNVNIGQIKQSIELIKNSSVEYEFRTTVVPQLYPKDKTAEIISLIGGADNYFLQQFENSVEVLDPKYQDTKAYDKKDLQELAEKLTQYFKIVKVKGAL